MTSKISNYANSYKLYYAQYSLKITCLNIAPICLVV